MSVIAYVNAGRWVGDCDRPDCGNAELLTARQSAYHCTNCHQLASVDWPVDVEDLTATLDVRPVPQTRNWAPAGHRQAIACGHPEGQSVTQLRDENAEHGVMV